MLKRLKEIYNYKEVLFNFVYQELTVKYKRSILGFFWSLLHPLLTMTISSIVFASIMRFKLQDFVIFIYSGLMPWNYFALTVDNSSVSILYAEGFIKKVYLPKSIYVLSGVVSNFINTLFSMISLFMIMFFIGAKVSRALLFLPISFVLLFFITLGWALIISTINVYFRDTRYLINVLLNAWYYLTPILYPIDMIKNKILHKVFLLNPMYYIIELFRKPIYEAKTPDINTLFISIIITIITLSIGITLFYSKEKDFVYKL